MKLSKSDHVEWLYLLVGIVVGITFWLHAPKLKAPKSDRFPVCYTNVCFADANGNPVRLANGRI